jgi:hypothetical protein
MKAQNRVARSVSPLRILVLTLLGMLAITTTVITVHDMQKGKPYTIVERSEAAPVLGVVIDQHLQVVSVDSWSPAARAGIQAGDALTTIGTVALPSAVSIPSSDMSPSTNVSGAITTANDVIGVFRQFVPAWERSVAITLRRNGKPITLQVLITAKAYNYNPSSPPPAATPIPATQAGSLFYL